MPKQSTTPFTFYTFRLDIDYEDPSNNVIIDKLCTWIKVNCLKYAIFKEIADKTKKPHIQGKVGIAKSGSQIRKMFKDCFPKLFVKSSYSMVPIEKPEEYDYYICKGGVVLINNVFTDEEILAKKTEYNEVKSGLLKDGKVKKVVTKTFTQSIADEYLEEYTHSANLLMDLSYTYHDSDSMKKIQRHLLSFIIMRLGKTAKVFDGSVLQRMYNGVKNYILHHESNPHKEDLHKYYTYWEQHISL